MLYGSRYPLLGMPLLALLGCAGSPPKSILDGPQEPANLPPPPAGSPVAVHGQLHVEGTTLKDQAGAPIQLKGVSSMWLNWETKPFAESKSGLEFMRDTWKLSVIRASMGIEAQQGYLTNADYMASKVETIVQNAVKAGVYVLVDWHTEQAVAQQAEAIRFFTAMAQKYGTYPNVIWETYNEPRGYSWPEIKAYHEAVVDAIRAVDPDNPIVLGTPTWSQDVDTASQDPVAPSSGATNLLYTLHFYSCTHMKQFRDKGDVAMANGIALFVTEFGATDANGGRPPKNTVCRDDANLWFAWMAQNYIGGVAWRIDQCGESSCMLTADAPTGGPWTDDVLTTDLVDTTSTSYGHGQFIVDWLRQ
jgi:endoglucanase